MTFRSHLGRFVSTGACVLATLPFSHSRLQDSTPGPMNDNVTARAEGSFEVELLPLPGDEGWGEFARMSLDKKFSGDLDGHSKGVMLAAHTAVEGSAGYVALERVSAELAGRKGSFVLQHSGLSGQGEQSLDVTVVTDSGTEALKGLAGTMEILFEEDGHSYVFTYSLPSK